MNRAVKISLGLATKAKQQRLIALQRSLRTCRQAYIDELWAVPGKLDAKTLNRVIRSDLSYRHRSNCLKTAIETVVATRRAAKVLGRCVTKPHVRNTVTLSSLVAHVEKGRGSFDYVLKIAGLKAGSPIVIPFKSHARLNYWLAKPGAKILQGCILGDGWAAIWIDIPTPKLKERGRVLAVDVGVNKLMVDSDGNQYGTEMKEVMARVRRCKPGSKGKLRARRARDQYINRAVKQLPWLVLKVIGHEDLKNLKQGKQKNRSKNFRKAIAPWTYRQALTRIEQLAQEYRVLPVSYDPRDTSRTCPRCGAVAKENRRGELFECVKCHYSNDADHVGALNGLARTRGNCEQSMVAHSLSRT